MADPRFYDNRGPFTLAAIREAAGLVPAENGGLTVSDLASLGGAGPDHLSFHDDGKALAESFRQSRAGFCLVPGKGAVGAPAGMLAIPCPSVPHAWAAVASLFYPAPRLPTWDQAEMISPAARLESGVIAAPGVLVGPGAEIGEGTRIGPHTVIAAGVTIGRGCEIGAHVTISHACIGDGVVILPGAQIGLPGFGFASSEASHVKIPQLGRVIIQDRAQIGACTTIDRGAIADTIIGEGAKIGNLLRIAHNVEIGRHAMLVSQAGIAGSSVVEDFAILDGQVGGG